MTLFSKWRIRGARSLASTIRMPLRFFSEVKKYGQPTPATHPHLLQAGEVNVGLGRDELRLRRERLVASLLEAGYAAGITRGLIIVPSAVKQYMVDKIPYFFRQDTDFRYLTGCLQPETVLLIEFTGSGCKTVLFLTENNPHDEKWEGTRFGTSEAIEFFGLDEALPLHSLTDVLYRYAKEWPDLRLWYDCVDPRNLKLHSILIDFLTRCKLMSKLEPIRLHVHELRSIKSEGEIQLMRQTCTIGAEGIRATMARSRELGTEAEYLAWVDLETRLKGANHLAYPPVVAAGNNATTIHYIAATGQVGEGELLLMDAGCEYHGYTSDITRTWPVRGNKFTPQQKILYEVVLECQQKLIASIHPGVSTIDDLYLSMRQYLGQGLLQAGLLPRASDKASVLRLASLYCPHNVGHHLGMDVHDCSSVSKSRPLCPGNIITIEPGLYIHATDTSVAKEFRGIGIRIEDDILVTESGCEILTAACPKTVPEIEQLTRS